MAGGDRSVFREKSLERLSSPERLDQLLRVLDRKTWLPLSGLAVLVAIGVLWSIFGSIPVNAYGRGILVQRRQVVEIQAPGPGYIERLEIEQGQLVEPGTVLALIDRSDLHTQLELVRQKEGQLIEQSEAMLRLAGDLMTVGSTAARYDGEDPFRAARALAESLRADAVQGMVEEETRLQEQLAIAAGLAEARRQRLEKDRELRDDGVISADALVEAEENWVESAERESRLRAELRDLRTRGLEIEEAYIERLQRIQDREQQIADVRREIARLETAVEKEGRIVSEHRGRILELSAGVGTYLAPGARVGLITVDDGGANLEGLTYFTVRDGKRLEPAMKIQVTPDTVERERFGSITGTVQEVSPFPVSLETVEHLVGNRGVAEALVSGGYRMQVWARLERDPETPSGFRWTSSRGPEMEFSAGTTTTVRVMVDERAPITFVLPFLKKTSGLD